MTELPDSVSRSEEAEILTRSEKYQRAYHDYKTQHCNTEGNQKSNLTHKQRQGLKSLKERVKSGELIICKTDKSDKVIAVSRELY